MGRRIRKLAAASSLIVAAAATIATSPAPYDASASLDMEATLTDQHPIDVKALTVTIVRGDDQIERPILNLRRGDYETSEVFDNFWLSLIPVDPGEGVRPPVPQLAESFGEVAQDLTEHCRDGCVRTYYVISQRGTNVHLPIDAGYSASLNVYEEARATGTKRPTASLELTETDFPEHIATLSSVVSGALDADLFGSTAWRGVIRVPAAALDVNAGPMFGSLWVHGDFDIDGGDRVAAHLWTAVNGTYQFGESLTSGWVELPVQREWLSACDRQGDCEVPIDIELRWNPPISLVPEGGHVHFEFTAEARLAYLGMSTAPPGAQLELAPR